MSEIRRFEHTDIGTQVMVRPALLAEVMQALHNRPEKELGHPMSRDAIERRLAPRDFGVMDVLHALVEHGLVTLYNAVSVGGTYTDAVLTEMGRAWKQPVSVTEDADACHAVPLRFVYMLYGELAVGTLADWAKAWEHQHYSGDDDLSTELVTWSRRDGYRVMVDRLTPFSGVHEWIDFRVWAAGEMVQVRIDGRA